MESIRQTILMGAAVVLALLIFAALVRAILGPRYTDRVIAVNVINTMVVAIICILSVYYHEDYLTDVALIYALLSFLTVVVLHRLVTVRQLRKQQNRQAQKRTEGEQNDR